MFIGKIDIHVSQLKLGMYVSELDRNWLGTPFLFQGFRIRDVSEIERLRQCCTTVVIDIEKSVNYESRRPVLTAVPASPRAQRTYKLSAAFEEEIRTANEIRSVTESCIDEVFDDVERGRTIDIARVKRVVHDTVDGILRNPDAHICLTHLKVWDKYTAQHSINVCILALALARHLGLSRHEMEMLGVGALLHDIGKLKTPQDVLNKPGKLTDDEFEIMRAHPVHGRRIIEDKYELSHVIADMAFSHHERIAGNGYPRGLNGNQMSRWSKMVAIVDVYDAITSDRCYHQGISATEALTKMYSWRLTDFDGELLEQFIQTVGIYPVGTLVELNSGEVGIVISVNPQARLKPKVNLLLDGEKNPYYPARIADLAQHEILQPEDNYFIQRVLNPGSFGIDIREQLEPIQQAKAKAIGID
jgi:putative nucleotidyltransferase with HDIG domain